MLSLLSKNFQKSLLAPLKAFKPSYIPLLTVYFAYGASVLGGISMSFWVKESLTLTAAQLASVGAWASMPWTIKMIWGQLIDALPILGSRRKAYVLIGSGFVALGLFVMGSLAGGFEWVQVVGNNFNTYLLGTILMSLGFAIQDAAADTMSTEVVARQKQDGKTNRLEKDIKADLAMVQVLGRLAFSLGVLSVAKLGGELARLAQVGEVITYETVFWIMMIIPLISTFGAIFVKLEQDSSSVLLQKNKAFDVQIFAGGIFLGLMNIGFGLVRIMENRFGFLAASADELMFVGSLLILGWMVLRITKDKTLAKRKTLFLTMAALFIFRVTPAVGAGLSWWMIDVLKFDPSFYGTLSQLGAIVPVVFLWLFSDIIAHKPVRLVLLFLIAAGTIMSLPELILYYGGPAIQTSARVIAIFDTAFESPLVYISMIPLLSLIAFHAPAQNRGTWFAVASSLLNLALSGAALFTKYLNKIFVVTREVLDPVARTVIVAADYSQLGMLMITAITISALVPLIAVLVLLPKK